MEETTDSYELIKVGGKTNPKSVGSTIARALMAGFHPEVRALGAGAVNQAVKGLIHARSFVAASGADLTVRFGFTDVPNNRSGDTGETVSAIAFYPVLN